MSTVAGRFAALFNGLNRAYGIYIVPPPGAPGGKRAGDARTVSAPVTEDLWQRHLNGEIQLGIVPVRDDAMAVFGAIDVDDYNTDHAALGAKIRKLKLPLVLCRSKSGGAHLYAFFPLPVEAQRVRELLAGWAAQLGYAKVEIFPKQDKLFSTEDTGNWINMPYSGGDATERYALVSGKQLNTEQFADYAEKHKVGPDLINSTMEQPELLTEAPPCLITLANAGIPEGGRNATLFALSVYARKRWPAGEWEEKVPELNAAFVSPPLSSGEVLEVIRNADKKDYNYTCKQEPLCSVCQRSICKNRKYGVLAHEQIETFGAAFENVVRLEVTPVRYYADYIGKRVAFDSHDLCTQNSMRQKIIEQTNTQLPRMTQKGYDSWTNEMLAKATIVEGPAQTAPGHSVVYALQQYCAREAPNRGWRALVTGGSRLHEGRVYFDANAFVAYVNRSGRGPTLTTSELWSVLLRHGVLTEERPLANGNGSVKLKLWHVPEHLVEFMPEEHDDGETEL